MFRKKKKTRVEKARHDLEKQIRVVNKQAKATRKDFIKNLNSTARDLRSEFEHLIDNDQRKQAAHIAKQLEGMALDVEKQAEKGIETVNETAQENVWGSVFVAFAIGIIFGLILKELMD